MVVLVVTPQKQNGNEINTCVGCKIRFRQHYKLRFSSVDGDNSLRETVMYSQFILKAAEWLDLLIFIINYITVHIFIQQCSHYDC